MLVDERDFEPTVVKKVNKFVSFKFGNVQILGILNFLVNATILDSSWKLKKHQRQKDSFQTNDSTTQINWKTKNFLHTQQTTKLQASWKGVSRIRKADR